MASWKCRGSLLGHLPGIQPILATVPWIRPNAIIYYVHFSTRSFLLDRSLQNHRNSMFWEGRKILAGNKKKAVCGQRIECCVIWRDFLISGVAQSVFCFLPSCFLPRKLQVRSAALPWAHMCTYNYLHITKGCQISGCRPGFMNRSPVNRNSLPGDIAWKLY